MMGQRSVYNACRPEVHDVLRRWRKLAETYDPPRVLIGETYVLEPEAFASFYGDGDELNLAFNFMLLHSEFEAAAAARRGRARRGAPPGARVAGVDGRQPRQPPFPDPLVQRRSGAARRAALVMLMGLRGTPFLYYGDEIGMIDTDVPADRILDPVGVFHGARMGRDDERTPMHWTADPGAGFSEPRRGAVAPVRRLRGDQRRRPAPRSRLDAFADARPHRTARRAARAARRRLHERLPARTTTCGSGGGASAPSSRAISRTTPVDVAGVGPGAIRVSTIRARDDERVDDVARISPRGKPRSSGATMHAAEA